jgi:hypothetical protein
MAPPTDQFASAPNPNSLWTEADQAKYHEAPADPSRSCVLGLGTANPETGLSMEDFGNMILDIYGYQDVPLAKSFVERVGKRASGQTVHVRMC